MYVIPSEGGEPRQLTYYPARGPLAPRWGFDHHVYGWSPDAKAVLFRSTRDYWGAGSGRLYTVPLEGGLPTALEMPLSGAGSISPGGRFVCLLSAVQGLPDMEAVSGRLGAGSLPVRPDNKIG